MWSKFCVALVTRYDLLPYKKSGTIELFILNFGYIHHYTPVALLLCSDNITDWSILIIGFGYTEDCL